MGILFAFHREKSSLEGNGKRGKCQLPRNWPPIFFYFTVTVVLNRLLTWPRESTR